MSSQITTELSILMQYNVILTQIKNKEKQTVNLLR
jgi:hypothetical protein